VTASEGKTIPAQAGPNIQAGLTAMTPLLEEIFLAYYGGADAP
jgi:hypothetical protein